VSTVFYEYLLQLAS